MRNSGFWDYTNKHGDSPLIKQIILLRDEIIAAEQSVEGAIQRINQWNSNGKPNSRLAYEYFRPRRAKLAWPKIVWQSFIMPKHSFILWLGLKEKLMTRDKLQGVIEDISCPLCNAAAESIEHLFFSCRIANKIWTKIKSWLRISRGMQTLKAAAKWLIKEARGTGVPAKIKRISLASTVYHLWEARNQRIFEGKIKQPEAIIRRVQIQVYRCMYGLFPDIVGFI
ncbi:uncharacterized protein LOC130751551 [Actinidia eriantha]|uniref:uncharacterized protein LOC130751551 n=1 Tax=Actinidia eriantha TaxID=165200 RepID=UPI00258B2F96|nr:uncharacterized protein LOC130751551 [Actinidia eriantha]